MDPEQVLLSPLAFEEREDEFRDTYVLEVESTLKFYMLEIKRTIGTRQSKSVIQNFLPDLIDILSVQQKQAFVALLVPKIKELYFIDLSDIVKNYDINDEESFLNFCDFLTFLEYRYVEPFGKAISDFELSRFQKQPDKIIVEKLNIIYQRLTELGCPKLFLSNIKFLPKDRLIELFLKMFNKYLMQIVSEAIISREVRYG